MSRRLCIVEGRDSDGANGAVIGAEKEGSEAYRGESNRTCIVATGRSDNTDHFDADLVTLKTT
jgi:hypothetical protein